MSDHEDGRWEALRTPASVAELISLATVLANEDVQLFLEFQSLEGSGRDRRAFVRAFFATVEALMWTFKQIALARGNDHSLPFDHKEVEALREWREVRKGGTARIQPVFSSFADNVTFAFQALARAYEEPHQLDTGSPEWQAFLDAANVRHRLMHPKRREHFEVTDDETRRIADVYRWFWKEAMGLMNAIAARPGHSWLPRGSGTAPESAAEAP